MSVIHTNNITNKDGTSGPTISGITTVSSTGFMRVPVGDTFKRNVVENVVKDGLVLYLDAGNDVSYAGSGTTWTDLSIQGNNGTLVNGVGFNSDNGGSLVFDGVDDYITTSYTPGTISSQTINCWINKSNLQFSFILANSSILYGLEIYPTTIYANINASAYSQVNYNLNGWQNITFVYDGSQTGNSNRSKIYLNSNLQALNFTGEIPSSVVVPEVKTSKFQIPTRTLSLLGSQ